LFDCSLPSPDTFARTFAHLDLDGMRQVVRHVYMRLKRNKAIKPMHSFYVAAIDGHETSSLPLRHCSGCLERTVEKKGGPVTQYYHRNVTLMLVTPCFDLLLDAEQQRPGESEGACAKRLLERAAKLYPRAFDLVLADALYATTPFIRLVKTLGKQLICVLKDNRRCLIEDAAGIFSMQQPLSCREGKTAYSVWDEENFSLENCPPVRVVKSVETSVKKNRNTGAAETKTSTWMWLSTINKKRLPTRNFVSLAHKRWHIENNGFKELVHLWHGDHVYHHHPTAIIAFWLTIMLAYNIVHAFVRLNIKPALRARHTFVYFTETIKASVYADPSTPP